MAKEKAEKSPAPDSARSPAVEGAEAAPPSPPKAPKAKKQSSDAGEGGKMKKRGRPMRGRSKTYRANREKIVLDKKYAMPDAVKLLKDVTKHTKFAQTVNIVMHLGIDPKNAEQMIRGSVSLPKGIGKTKRVIAFCEGEDADKAREAGAIEVGVDDLIKKVNDGWTEFDVAISHPRVMAKVGKLGRVLGPSGKMPSPKNGTVTPEIAAAVKDFAAGKIEFRNDAGGNVHAIVGKANFAEQDLSENIDAFIGHIRRMKPPTSKGVYIKKVCISGTMSPAIELEVAQ